MSETTSEQAIEVIRQLVEDNGYIMPGWSILADPHTYVCSYCGAVASMNYAQRIFMKHDDDCPVHLGEQLVRRASAQEGE